MIIPQEWKVTTTCVIVTLTCVTLLHAHITKFTRYNEIELPRMLAEK